MNPVEYINSTFTILSDISERNNTKLARNNIDGRLYVLKFSRAYDYQIYEALRQYNIPGIPRIYETLYSPSGIYIVEEYVDGISFDEYIGGSEDRMISLIVQLCDILSRLHSLNPPIIHRDIKPDNILISRSGQVMLTDFNISRPYTGGAARDTFAMGTFEFAAPEQYGFRESDARTDLYGLGATVRYLMKRSGISSERLEAFVGRAMAFSPDERFGSASEARDYIINYYAIRREAIRQREEAARMSSWRRFLPPGYRTGRSNRIIVATIIYFFELVNIFYSVRSILSNEGVKRHNYIIASLYEVLIFIFVVGFSFNYMGIQDKIGLNRNPSRNDKGIIILVDIIFIIALSIILSMFVVK